MRMIPKAAIASLSFVLLLSAGSTADAQSIKVRVGQTTGGSGFHIPSYVAMDKGFFKNEGLDADFIAATAGVLVRATIAREIEFTPIPGGGSEAMLQGAPIVFIVGESLISQWTLTTTPDIKRVEDLKGRTLGLGRPGSADYGDPARAAPIVRASVHGVVLPSWHAARAEKEGMKILVRTGDYLPRLGGTFL